MEAMAGQGQDRPGYVPMTPERGARMATLFVPNPDWKDVEVFFPGTGFMNAKEFRASETLSANVNASARGLAKLGSYMS